MKPEQIKADLYNKCLEYIENRIQNARNAMESAQDSANEETKSSAGDKYETGRAMAQLEREKYALQLSEAVKIRKALEGIDIQTKNEAVSPGSLAFTSQGNFFMAISAGKFSISGREFFTVAPAAPLAKELMGKRPGDVIIFNKKEIVLEKVY